MPPAAPSSRAAPRFIVTREPLFSPILFARFWPEPVVGPPRPHIQNHVLIHSAPPDEHTPRGLIAGGCDGHVFAMGLFYLGVAAVFLLMAGLVLGNASLSSSLRFGAQAIVMISFGGLFGGLFLFQGLAVASARVVIRREPRSNELHIDRTRFGRTRTTTVRLRDCTLTVAPLSEPVGKGGRRRRFYAVLLHPPRHPHSTHSPQPHPQRPVALHSSSNRFLAMKSYRRPQDAAAALDAAERWMHALDLNAHVHLRDDEGHSDRTLREALKGRA